MYYHEKLKIAIYNYGSFEILEVKDPIEKPYAGNVEKFNILSFHGKSELVSLIMSAGKEFVLDLVEQLQHAIVESQTEMKKFCSICGKEIKPTEILYHLGCSTEDGWNE